jgi:MFS family permease
MNQEKKFYGWTMVGVFWTLYFINLAFPYMGAGVINPWMAKSLNLSRSTLGLGFTLMTLLAGLFGPLVALSLNKKGVRFTMVMGSLSILLGSLLMGLVVGNHWQFILVFGLLIGTGIGFSTAVPTQTGITHWFTKKRALAMSLTFTASGIGAFVAAPLLNKVITVFGGDWRVAWLFVAGIVGCGTLLTIFLVKNKPSDLGQVPDGIYENDTTPGAAAPVHSHGSGRVFRTTEQWTLRDAMKTPALWMILASFVVLVATSGIIHAHSVIHLRDLGNAPATAAMSLGLMMFSSVAGRLLAGVLGDRIEPRYIWAAGMAFMFIGILSIMKANSTIQIYMYALFLGLGYGAIYISWPIITSNYFGPASFASIMGLQGPVITIAGSSAPFLAGLVYDRTGSYNNAFIALAVLCLASGALILCAKPPELNRQPVPIENGCERPVVEENS